jgi:hypothetical protein
MGYENPLLRLPAAQKIMAMPAEQRSVLEQLMRELRADADTLAERSWGQKKGPMAAYWRAVSTYARHIAIMLRGAGRAPSASASAPPAPTADGKLGAALAALQRIADMRDRDGNAIEMHRDELRGIARTALRIAGDAA